MSRTYDLLLAAARRVAARDSLDSLTLAEVAREAGVSWPTVRRHLGTREALQALLLVEDPGLASAETDTRTRILQAARRTFARRGYVGATIDEIGADAGLTKGAVYWHFSSKMELFKAILAEQRATDARALEADFGRWDPGTPLHESLAQAIEADLERLQEQSDWVWLIFEFLTSSRDPEVRQLMVDSSKDILGRLTQRLEELQTAGVLSADRDPLAITQLWAAVLNGLAVVQLIRPIELAEHRHKVASQLGWLLAYGLAPDREPPAPTGRRKRRQ